MNVDCSSISCNPVKRLKKEESVSRVNSRIVPVCCTILTYVHNYVNIVTVDYLLSPLVKLVKICSFFQYYQLFWYWWIKIIKKPQVHRLSRFCTAHEESPYTLQRAPLSQKLPLPIGGSGLPSNLWIPWNHPNPQPKRHPYRFSRLCTDGIQSKRLIVKTSHSENVRYTKRPKSKCPLFEAKRPRRSKRPKSNRTDVNELM